MSNKNILKLSLELREALDNVDFAYSKYVSAIRMAADIAEKLDAAATLMSEKPDIPIVEFEIDS